MVFLFISFATMPFSPSPNRFAPLLPQYNSHKVSASSSIHTCHPLTKSLLRFLISSDSGYCYLRLALWKHRRALASMFGPFPKLKELMSFMLKASMFHSHNNIDICRSFDGSCLHIYSSSTFGRSPASLFSLVSHCPTELIGGTTGGQDLAMIMITLQQEVAQLRAENTQHQANLATLQAMSPSKAQLKMNPPPEYHGEPDHAQKWLTEVELYYVGRKVTDDEERVLDALSRITKGKNDIAQNWADGACQKIANGTPLVWSDFKVGFLEYFQHSELAEAAQTELINFAQEAKTIEEYIARFEYLGASSGYGDLELRERFVQRLKPPLHVNVKTFNVERTCSTLSSCNQVS